jgi:hypothetical protein
MLGLVNVALAFGRRYFAPAGTPAVHQQESTK